MDPFSWGLNPPTIQAGGAVATAAALFLLAWSLYHVRKQTSIADQEFKLRTRAWLAIRGLDPQQTNRGTDPIVQFRYENMGDTPATDIHISVQLTTPSSGTIFSRSLGMLFAHGFGSDNFQISNCWRGEAGSPSTFDVAFNVTLTYSTSGRSCCTKSTGEISWQDGHGFTRSYRNVDAT